jgi:hypothetical protein
MGDRATRVDGRVSSVVATSVRRLPEGFDGEEVGVASVVAVGEDKDIDSRKKQEPNIIAAVLRRPKESYPILISKQKI